MLPLLCVCVCVDRYQQARAGRAGSTLYMLCKWKGAKAIRHNRLSLGTAWPASHQEEAKKEREISLCREGNLMLVTSTACRSIPLAWRCSAGAGPSFLSCRLLLMLVILDRTRGIDTRALGRRKIQLSALGDVPGANGVIDSPS